MARVGETGRRPLSNPIPPDALAGGAAAFKRLKEWWIDRKAATIITVPIGPKQSIVLRDENGGQPGALIAAAISALQTHAITYTGKPT